MSVIDSITFTLRDYSPEDEEFLCELYASTRTEEIAAWGWDKEQQAEFLKMQFNAQRLSFERQYPGADHRIIIKDGLPIGRIIIYRSKEEILLVDISLLRSCRSHGIGSALIKHILAEASETDRPVRLHVEWFNRARRLYERLGFVSIGETPYYLHMEWRPENSSW